MNDLFAHSIFDIQIKRKFPNLLNLAGNSVELIRCLCVARFWQSLFWYSKSLKRVIRVRHRKYL